MNRKSTVTILSREEFGKHVIETLQEIAENPNIDGVAKFIIPSIGLIFAKNLETKIFGEEVAEE